MEGCRSKRIEDIPWYHDISRNSSEALLLAYGKQGSYLIRPSKNNPGHYAVSVRSLESVKHFSLRCDQGKFVFGVGEFSDAEELMEHFQNYPIVAGETGQPITLAHPYSSKIEEPSIYDDISKHAVCGKSLKWRNSSTCTSEKDPEDIDWSVSVMYSGFFWEVRTWVMAPVYSEHSTFP